MEENTEEFHFTHSVARFLGQDRKTTNHKIPNGKIIFDQIDHFFLPQRPL